MKTQTLKIQVAEDKHILVDLSKIRIFKPEPELSIIMLFVYGNAIGGALGNVITLDRIEEKQGIGTLAIVHDGFVIVFDAIESEEELKKHEEYEVKDLEEKAKIVEMHIRKDLETPKWGICIPITNFLKGLGVLRIVIERPELTDIEKYILEILENRKWKYVHITRHEQLKACLVLEDERYFECVSLRIEPGRKGGSIAKPRYTICAHGHCKSETSRIIIVPNLSPEELVRKLESKEIQFEKITVKPNCLIITVR